MTGQVPQRAGSQGKDLETPHNDMDTETSRLLKEARERDAMAAEAAKRAIGLPEGAERDKALAAFFCQLMVTMGMGYHPDGWDAATVVYNAIQGGPHVWNADAAKAVNDAHDEALERITGLDAYDAFAHDNVVSDLEAQEDKNDPETYQWHVERVNGIVQALAPGWEAIPAEVLNASERRAESGVVYAGPWVFHPNGDGGDTDPNYEGEFWEVMAKLTSIPARA